MRAFDYIKEPEKLLTPEIVQMTGKIHEHKGKQEIFLEANIDELKTLLEVALICIFRKNRALAPHERSAVPLGTDHCPVG